MQHKLLLFQVTPLLFFLVLPWADAFSPANGAAASYLHQLSSPMQERSASSAIATVNQQEATPATPPPTRPPTVTIDSLTSVDSLLDLIDQAPTDSLVVIKFYGKSCPLCKRVAIKYKKLARYYSTAPIRFAEIDNRVHPDLFTTLGVTTFPYLQVYRNGQCIASHGTQSAQQFERIVNDTIQRFLCMTPPDWQSFLAAFEGPIQHSTANLERVKGMMMMIKN